MTQKELLYVEDAIGHEKEIVAIINNIIDCLEDSNLTNFMSNRLEEHTMMIDNLMNKLEVKSNE